jgi:hypothetical protein
MADLGDSVVARKAGGRQARWRFDVLPLLRDDDRNMPRGVSDYVADKVLALSARATPPAMVANALGITVEAVRAVILEPYDGRCAICKRKVRVGRNRTARWHVRRDGDTRACRGVGLTATRPVQPARPPDAPRLGRPPKDSDSRGPLL